jgi:hypothetical protein
MRDLRDASLPTEGPFADFGALIRSRRYHPEPVYWVRVPVELSEPIAAAAEAAHVKPSEWVARTLTAALPAAEGPVTGK